MSDRMRLVEGWSSFFLLFVMLISVATSISAVRWTTGLGNLPMAAALGLTLGLLLAKSRFPATLAHLFSLFYGLFAIGYMIGRMVDQPTWRERVLELGERFATWLTKATSGGTSRDSLMFVLLLTGLFWLLGYIAAWYTYRRHRLWRVLLPIGLTLLVNYYVYTDPRIVTRSTASLTPYLLIFVLTTLLYIVRTNVYLRELEWQRYRVNYSTDVRIDFVRSGTILGLIAVIAMVVAPGASASPYIADMWQGVEDVRDDVRTTAARLFSSLDARGRGVGNAFPDRAVLGGPRDLGNDVIFDVRAPSGRYWRAMVYDRYTGSDWISTDDHRLDLPPGATVSSGNLSMRHVMTQEVTIYLGASTQLFAAPEPLRVPGFSTRANITFDQGKVISVASLFSRNTLRAGNIYEIVSMVSRADPESLRSASENYGDWVKGQYLQLPSTVTDRTKALAHEITADYDTAFDKAQAIEQYLRQNLEYDLDVPAPSDDEDFVDFVLFDLQTGYCDYYATSFVVLARSAGVPARMAMGYAQSEYDEDAGAIRVRANNGHSWPEVFFPQYGWIQFEPTVVIDPINWPEPPPDPNADPGTSSSEASGPSDPLLDLEDPFLEEGMLDGSSSFVPTLASEQGPSSGILVLVGLLIVAGLGTGATYWVTERRGIRGLSLVERAYTRMWRFAAWLGVPGLPHQTPYELAKVLKELMPEAEPPIKRITDMYVAERFGRGNGNDDSSDADQQWSALRFQLWKAWFQNKLSRFQRKRRHRRQDFHAAYYAESGAPNGRRADE